MGGSGIKKKKYYPLAGKPKWLPLNFRYHDIMRTAPIEAILALALSTEQQGRVAIVCER